MKRLIATHAIRNLIMGVLFGASLSSVWALGPPLRPRVVRCLRTSLGSPPMVRVATTTGMQMQIERSGPHSGAGTLCAVGQTSLIQELATFRGKRCCGTNRLTIR